MDIVGALGREPPERESLPRWLAPLPKSLEDVAFRFVWVIVAINLLGTAFGFWYYRFQFREIPVEMWAFVPDSPGATLLIALALAAWAVGAQRDWLTALAFFGNVKLGLWTPYVLVVFYPQFLANSGPAMYAFLLVSHLGMVVQAFVLYRITDFPVKAVAVATAWYTVDLLMDYFVPVIGDVTHTSLPYLDSDPWFTTTVLQVAAAGAVTLTVIPLFWALATRVATLRLRLGDGEDVDGDGDSDGDGHPA
ncbi:hypothetical protein C461_06404 [Halorubrum aidingense JCM 13560]|uniref:DUF1405 domain-containing protein n=1 Tax=Halorubrum aidingense JCM 13560 TaxID=1230454 RepID=M0PDR8_9EURY|nr:DUF1405 domain-containing protein [Halorubrum aidingense]EMA68191.1 hypothetical protein C461_06404 [Halorubrum aidingense JCM 13560]